MTIPVVLTLTRESYRPFRYRAWCSHPSCGGVTGLTKEHDSMDFLHGWFRNHVTDTGHPVHVVERPESDPLTPFIPVPFDAIPAMIGALKAIVALADASIGGSAALDRVLHSPAVAQCRQALERALDVR